MIGFEYLLYTHSLFSIIKLSEMRIFFLKNVYNKCNRIVAYIVHQHFVSMYFTLTNYILIIELFFKYPPGLSHSLRNKSLELKCHTPQIESSIHCLCEASWEALTSLDPSFKLSKAWSILAVLTAIMVPRESFKRKRSGHSHQKG